MKKLIILCGVAIMLTACGEQPAAQQPVAQQPATQQPTAQQPAVMQQPNQNDNVPDKVSNATTEQSKIAAMKISDVVDTTTVTNKEGVIELKFRNTNSDEYIKSISGKKVTITGYISSLSPISGKFAYLMNLPYQSCPFCVPGTSAIYNTLAVYASGNDKIKFTDKPVTVTGTLETGSFTDEFGYQYDVRINNAKVVDADVSKLSKNVLIYSAISKEGIVADINTMFGEIDQLIYFDFYEQQYGVSRDGIKEFDLERINTVINKLNSISKTDYADLTTVLQDTYKLTEQANNNLKNNQIEKNIELQENISNAFNNFFMWLAKYEV